MGSGIFCAAASTSSSCTAYSPVISTRPSGQAASGGGMQACEEVRPPPEAPTDCGSLGGLLSGPFMKPISRSSRGLASALASDTFEESLPSGSAGAPGGVVASGAVLLATAAYVTGGVSAEVRADSDTAAGTGVAELPCTGVLGRGAAAAA